MHSRISLSSCVQKVSTLNPANNCTGYSPIALETYHLFYSLLDQSVYQQKSLEQLELKFIGKGKISLRVIRTSLVLLITMWIIVFIPALATEYGMRNRYAFYSPGNAGIVDLNFGNAMLF